MIITTHYEEVGFKRDKTGKCAVCGKTAKRTEKFWQTINPWNKKTSLEIMKEEEEKAEKWMKEPVVHQKCESEYRKAKHKKKYIGEKR